MPNSNLLEAQISYESLDSFDIDSAISNLDEALSKYTRTNTGSSQQANRAYVESAFAPIAEYYAKLTNINNYLQKYISSATKTIAESDPRLLSEERYTNRIHPEESVEARESSWGVIPELRSTTIPYLLGVSVFMAFLSLFLIFQIFGFSGQINIPPSITDFINVLLSPAQDSYFMNPVILVYFGIFFVLGCIFSLYFRARNTNKQ